MNNADKIEETTPNTPSVSDAETSGSNRPVDATPFQTVLTRLTELNGHPAVQKGEWWMTNCPVHDDHTPSLGLKETADGVAIKCFAECKRHDILRKLKLTAEDLKTQKSQSQIKVVYPYHDEDGTLLYEAIRYEPKAFRQRKPDGRGGYVWSMKDVKRVPYQLPDLLAAVSGGKVIYIVEGEKDADALRALGLAATTNSGGAGKWLSTFSAYLQGAFVVILPDNDEPGTKHAEQVAHSLVGSAKEIRILALPQLPPKGDVSDWLTSGHSGDELETLVKQTAVFSLPPAAEILDMAPATIRRPLCLIDGYAYAVVWVTIQTGEETQKCTVIVRNDGRYYSDHPLPECRPLKELGLKIELHEAPPEEMTWSGAGVKRFVNGERPDPAAVFRRCSQSVSHFMDFNESFDSQSEICDLIAVYVMGTYLLAAFSVVGYIWSNGERGTAKTKLLSVITKMAHLGLMVLAGGSYASLRDLADYGAAIAFDDCDEMLSSNRGDPDKRSLLLAGNRRGAFVTVKEPAGKNEWVTRYIDAFCPRLFSAISLPDPVLASRSIVIPLIRSVEDLKANSDPEDNKQWPVNRRELIDDLFAVGLTHLPELSKYDELGASRSGMIGRDLDPWRMPLGVSLWLEENWGVEGLYSRMLTLCEKYQAERSDLEDDDPTRILILSLARMLVVSAQPQLVFSTGTLAQSMNEVAVENECPVQGVEFTNAQKVGRLLKQLRFEKMPRTSRSKQWRVSAAGLHAIARSHSMVLPGLSNGINGTNGISAQESAVPLCHECTPCHDARGGATAELDSASVSTEASSVETEPEDNTVEVGEKDTTELTNLEPEPVLETEPSGNDLDWTGGVQ